MNNQLYESPVGTLLIRADGGKVTHLTWAQALPLGFLEAPNATTERAVQLLQNYFQNPNQTFDLEYDLSSGTDFQQRVWRTLLGIPAGTTQTYQELAAHLNSSPRAVGGAVGANPVPICIPCHRVVGQGGILTGYSGGGGVKTKQKLLAHEGVPAGALAR